nr:wiskott-Aldrich syndrome protein family member 2-like [Globicephala melas]
MSFTQLEGHIFTPYRRNTTSVNFISVTTCLDRPWLEETLDTDQGQRVLRSGAQSTPRRRSALSPAGPPSGKPARRAEAPSPAARTGPQSARRSRPRCPGTASPSDQGLSAASGTLAADRMPTFAWGPRLASRPLGRPPPEGCGPASCAGPASQPEDIGPWAPARPGPPCRAPEPTRALVLARASTASDSHFCCETSL